MTTDRPVFGQLPLNTGPIAEHIGIYLGSRILAVVEKHGDEYRLIRRDGTLVQAGSRFAIRQRIYYEYGLCG